MKFLTSFFLTVSAKAFFWSLQQSWDTALMCFLQALLSSSSFLSLDTSTSFSSSRVPFLFILYCFFLPIKQVNIKRWTHHASVARCQISVSQFPETYPFFFVALLLIDFSYRIVIFCFNHRYNGGGHDPRSH